MDEGAVIALKDYNDVRFLSMCNARSDRQTTLMRHDYYPVDWPAIARAVKEANGWRCQACGKQCRRPGELNLGWEYTLTVAHLTQDYDADAVTVAALCLPCHLRYDARHSWIARLRRLRWRRVRAGQLEIFR